MFIRNFRILASNVLKTFINRGYYTVSKSYGLCLRVAKIERSETSEMFWPREDKIHIFWKPCNVLFIIWAPKKLL